MVNVHIPLLVEFTFLWLVFRFRKMRLHNPQISNYLKGGINGKLHQHPPPPSPFNAHRQYGGGRDRRQTIPIHRRGARTSGDWNPAATGRS